MSSWMASADAHRGGDGRRRAGALGQVGRLDRVYDQVSWHPIRGQRQADRVIQAEAV